MKHVTFSPSFCQRPRVMMGNLLQECMLIFFMVQLLQDSTIFTMKPMTRYVTAMCGNKQYLSCPTGILSCHSLLGKVLYGLIAQAYPFLPTKEAISKAFCYLLLGGNTGELNPILRSGMRCNSEKMATAASNSTKGPLEVSLGEIYNPILQ